MNVLCSFLLLRTFTAQCTAARAHAAKKVALFVIATSLCLSGSILRSYSQNGGAATYSREQLIDQARQML